MTDWVGSLETRLLALGTTAAWGTPEGGRQSTSVVLGLFASQEFFYRENLHTRELVIWEMLRYVESRGNSFLLHGVGGRFQGHEQANLGFLPLHVTLQGSDLTSVHMTALDLHYDALGLAAGVVRRS